MKKPFILALVTLIMWPALHGYAEPTTSRECFREGYEASMARQWEKSIEWYDKSIQLDPKNAEAFFQRAVSKEMIGRIDDAIADYHKVLELKPKTYLALEYLAKLYEKRGEYRNALICYEQALPLVRSGKWRSVVKWWISQAKKKLKAEEKRSQNDRPGKRARRSPRQGRR